MSDSTESRERFEKVAKEKGLVLSRYIHDESYVNPHTRDKWEAWQVAEAGTRARCALAVQEKE